MVKEWGTLFYSSIGIIASGISSILPAPASISDRYLIWGFTIDVSSQSSVNLSFQSDLSSVFYVSKTVNTGQAAGGFQGNKNQNFAIPINAGYGRSLKVAITGFNPTGALSGIVGVYYTP